jgi:hypothetical protein
MSSRKLVKYFAFLSASIFSTSSFAQFDQAAFSKLHTLCGMWSMETKKGMLYERWQKVNDSTLSGKSYRVNKTDTVMLEDVDLVIRNYNIYYIPRTTGQNDEKPVTFTLKTMADSKYVFENLQHDFPQKIVYELPLNNGLHAWIEGNTSSGAKRLDYTYKKS